MPVKPRSSRAVSFLAWTILLSACTATPGGSDAAAGVATPAESPRDTPRTTEAPSGEPAPSAGVATPATGGPPLVLLAAEGGDPVAGQLGSYTWGDTGSDSPWVPGAPLTVGTGEPLTVALQAPLKITAWRARYVTATGDGPDGARSLGEGTGTPAFEAPGPGSWTLEIRITFAEEAGDASYFWRLDIT